MNLLALVFATQIAIWPGKPPEWKAPTAPETTAIGKKLIAGRPLTAVTNVSRPTMTVDSPQGKNSGVAVVVFPGGGYRGLAIDLEGSEACDWLAAKGITCVLLKYRVPNSGPAWDDACHCYVKSNAALQDAQRTVGLLRSRAGALHIDPHKIGVLGFSAGGHLVANLSMHFVRRAYQPVDDADKESCRPDFGIGIYPGLAARRFEAKPATLITSQMPPQFLLQAEDDPVDDVNDTLLFYIALQKAHVPAEMHLYAHGGHAFGLRPSKFPITHWPALVETWLKTIGVLPE
ncbi:MAG TPA: alpha/beta hydrolase [Thermoanaerobaculia bacterium]